MSQPTHEEFIARAQRIAAVAEQHVAASERDGEFPQALADIVRETHMNRLLRPRRLGGYGMGPRTFAEVVRTVARSSSAAAWLMFFIPLHEQWVCYLPKKAREEILATDGFVGDVFGPIGQIEYVEGGVKLSGQWNWGSGIGFCEWCGLGAMVKLPGFDQPQPCLVTVRRPQWEVIRNWNSFGLRGTGSHAVKVENAFVPYERILPIPAVKMTGKPVDNDYDAEEPIYRQPFTASFLLGFLAIALGGAERVTKELIDRTKQRQRVMYGVKEWESPATQRNIAEVDVRRIQVEAAYERYIGRLEQCVARGESVMSAQEENEMGALRSYAVREASDLAFRAFELLGGSAAYQGDPVERFARDLFMVRVHISQLYDDHMVSYGRTLFGLPPSVMG